MHETIQPATLDEVLAALRKFTVAFDVFDDRDLEAKFALLAEAVEGEPIWAVRKGVDDFALGRVERKRRGLPLASELGPHVADLTAAARLRATAATRQETQARVMQEPAEGDGIEFGMTKAEQAACATHFADLFKASGSRSRPRFFATIMPAEIKDWLVTHRRSQAQQERAA